MENSGGLVGSDAPSFFLTSLPAPFRGLHTRCEYAKSTMPAKQLPAHIVSKLDAIGEWRRLEDDFATLIASGEEFPGV